MLKNITIKTLLWGTLCFLCVSCSSMQSPGSDNNSAEGFQKAPTNQAESQERLGIDYLLGRGVPENSQEAFNWFHKAAEQGNGYAANELAYMYASGKGVGQNYQLALQWYEQAASAGIASAKYNLGLMYAYGLGTATDQAKADGYFQQAADAGFKVPEKGRV